MKSNQIYQDLNQMFGLSNFKEVGRTFNNSMFFIRSTTTKYVIYPLSKENKIKMKVNQINVMESSDWSKIKTKILSMEGLYLLEDLNVKTKRE